MSLLKAAKGLWWTCGKKGVVVHSDRDGPQDALHARGALRAVTLYILMSYIIELVVGED